MYYLTTFRTCQPHLTINFFSHHTPVKPTPSYNRPSIPKKNILTTITLPPYNTPIVPLRAYEHASSQAKPRPASRSLTHRRRVCIALGASERVPRVLFRASARPKVAPVVAVRACIMRGRTVLGETRRRWHGKPSSVAWCEVLRQEFDKSSVACAWLASSVRGVT